MPESLLKRLVQLTEVNRSSDAFGSAKNPFNSLHDPTWNQLTGGDVFRPTLPPGFHGPPFSSGQVPGRYKPTSWMNIEGWVKDHLQDGVDLAAIVAMLAGQPELATLISATDTAVKAGTAFYDGRWVEGIAGVISLAIPVAGNYISGVGEVTEQFSLGDQLGAAVDEALSGAGSEVPAAVAKKIGEEVQDRVNEYFAEQAQKAVDGGEKDVEIPASVLQNFILQAAEKYGAQQSLTNAANG